MKRLLAVLALAAACKAPKVPEPAPPAPSVAAPADGNAVVKYVGRLQTDVKLAQEAKEKADAANKKAEEAGKIPE